jgi:hypothetical protein
MGDLAALERKEGPKMDEKSNIQDLDFDEPVSYCILVKGHLEDWWSDRLGGLKIKDQTQLDDFALTELEGEVLDQAALFGILNTLYDLRMPLITVQCCEINEGE